jgi:hypothetical protein
MMRLLTTTGALNTRTAILLLSNRAFILVSFLLGRPL